MCVNVSAIPKRDTVLLYFANERQAAGRAGRRSALMRPATAGEAEGELTPLLGSHVEKNAYEYWLFIL